MLGAEVAGGSMKQREADLHGPQVADRVATSARAVAEVERVLHGGAQLLVAVEGGLDLARGGGEGGDVDVPSWPSWIM